MAEDYTEWTPITEDGKVSKVILQAGTGEETPGENQEVDVNYIGTLLQDGTEFDRNDDPEDPFQFFIGTDEIIQGWNHAVKTMLRGEKAKFKISPEYAYGESGSQPKIPADAWLVFEITLIDFRDRTKSKYDYEPEERVPMGIEMKAKGNELFRANKQEEAKAQYKEAAEFLDEELGEEALTNYVGICTNMSLILYKEKNYVQSIEWAAKAIDKDPQTVKAYYRMGMAQLAMKNYENAITNLETGLKLDPSNNEIKKAINEAKKQVNAENKKKQSLYKNMFGGDLDLGYKSSAPVKPSAKDWSSPNNPKVFFDIKVGEEEPERIEFELFKEAAPKSVENFRCLCTGEKGAGSKGINLHFKGNKFHRLIIIVLTYPRDKTHF